jgi:parvulin-like peptidyl-prolyl cis-trans isomerase-like protein
VTPQPNSAAAARADGARPLNAGLSFQVRATRVNYGRSMTLCATGALVGLILAGVSLFNARGTQTNTVPPEDVALVSGQPLLRSDYVTQLEGETGAPYEQSTHAQQLHVVDEMVREELLVQRALELGFGETDQQVRNALVNSVTQQILGQVTTSEPTEQTLQRYYEDNRSHYVSEGMMTVRHLMLPPEAAATAAALQRVTDAVRDLRAATSVEAVMSRYGLKEPRNDSDEFHFAARIHLGDAVFARAVVMTDNTVSDPIPLPDGIHLIKMIHNVAPVPLSYERSRSQVLGDYKSAQQTRLMQGTLKFLHERGKILVSAEYQRDYPE